MTSRGRTEETKDARSLHFKSAQAEIMLLLGPVKRQILTVGDEYVNVYNSKERPAL